MPASSTTITSNRATRTPAGFKWKIVTALAWMPAPHLAFRRTEDAASTSDWMRLVGETGIEPVALQLRRRRVSVFSGLLLFPMMCSTASIYAAFPAPTLACHTLLYP
jgi:hypothetical protein